MARKKPVVDATIAHDHQRGTVNDNHLKALVTSPLFQVRVEKSGKGKGSFQRTPKHRKGWECGQQSMMFVAC
ncbi:ribosome alternative rescue factor ArfA [Aeromonas schubertii]|uniref:ribosome alternative rescue factor ArfA n=1 Tax=Aeromonas schubertii TaxID=652 RepID=UPI00067F5393|nr:ribosome alternative rescue factor ArfA [Aeromonas schubertii]KUE78139.1 hypothetical protein ATO46_12005 [Aeromonas schubertii]MBZ6073830.1 ribosome alternative rescue factor ArfA [Aeromonas schubertii]